MRLFVVWCLVFVDCCLLFAGCGLLFVACLLVLLWVVCCCLQFGVARNGLATKYPWGVEHYKEEIEHRTSDTNPALTSVVGKYKISHELKDRTLDFHQNVEFKSDEENFYLIFHRWVSVNGKLIREKVWEETIPRDYQ